MSEQGQDDNAQEEEFEVRGPTLVGDAAGIFVAVLHHQFLKIAQEEAEKISQAQEDKDKETLEPYSKNQQTLLKLTPDVFQRLQIHLTAHFQTGVNREVLFDSLMKALQDKDQVEIPRKLKPKTCIDSILGCREKLEFYFDPAPGRAFESAEKGLLTKAFKAAHEDEATVKETIKWATNIYRHLADQFDASWNLQYETATKIPDAVDFDQVLGLEEDERFPRNLAESTPEDDGGDKPVTPKP